MIGFIRHGITAWNKEGRTQGKIDVPLSDEGIRMGEQLAVRLESETWSTIYTSPLQRAKQTALLISRRQHDTEVIVDNRLREIGEGKKEGTTEKERIEKWGEAWQTLKLNIEEDQEVIERATSFIEEVKTKHIDGKILVVSHGSFIQRVLEMLCPDTNFPEEIKNASLTILTIKDDNQTVLFNCVEHLT